MRLINGCGERLKTMRLTVRLTTGVYGIDNRDYITGIGNYSRDSHYARISACA